jgi:hypothetical protein
LHQAEHLLRFLRTITDSSFWILERAMRIAKRLSMTAAGLSFLVVAACGGSVTGPSPAAGAGGGGSGATILGTVNGGGPASLTTSVSAGATGATAPAAGLVVTVTGTNLTATADAFGRFEIAGVPSGTVQLQFKNATVNATLQISNVGSHRGQRER